MNSIQEETLREMKDVYNKQINKLESDGEANYFHWNNNRHLNIWIINYKRPQKGKQVDDWVGFAYFSENNDHLTLL